MSAGYTLGVDALRDALGRRIVPVLVVICVLSIMALDSCTSCAPAQIEVNGVPQTLEGLPGGMSLLTLVVLGLWVIVLAGILSADHLRNTLEEGYASLALSRPVSRTSYAFARLAGALGVALGVGALLLVAASYLVAVRAGLPLTPVLGSSLACILGAVTVGALSMTLSLHLPRLPSVLLVFAAVGVIALANLLGATRVDPGGWLSAIDQWGPPLAAGLAAPLQDWLPADYTRLDSGPLFLRLLFWSAIALFQLGFEFRRLEIRG